MADLSLLGVEALIRWEHPTRGLVQPDDFIPGLEANSRIIQVGRWVLLEARRQLKAWRAQHNGLAMLTMSVNVSGRQLDYDGIIDDVAQALTMSCIDPGQLTLEITETALMKDVSKLGHCDVYSEALAGAWHKGSARAVSRIGCAHSSSGAGEP